jgi:hypothetical protein
MLMSGVTKRAFRVDGYLDIRQRDCIPVSALEVDELGGVNQKCANSYSDLSKASVKHRNTNAPDGYLVVSVLA